MPDSECINQASLHLVAPELHWAVALGQGSKERGDNLAMVEVHCRVLSVLKLIKSGQAVLSLIFGLGPERAYCSCLTTYRLLFAPSELWQEGFQEQLWSVSACHSALVTAGAGSPLQALEGLDPEWKARWVWNNQLSVVEQTSGC